MPARVADVDIRHLDYIDGLAGYDAVEILFRLGREPLGRARITADDNSISPNELQPLIMDLPSPSSLNPPKDSLQTITIAICTLNRLEELSAVLHSLTRQEYSADEIIVVDNGCQEEIRQLVEKILPNGRYVPERRKGLDFARNRAISEATGEIIAFLDDDVEADPFWVKSVAECFASFPKAGAVTGLVLPLELETPAQELFEKYGGFARGFARRVLPRDSKRRFGLQLPLVAEAISVGTGCNMAFKTAVLKQLNGFDEALDTGPPLPGGGDLDIFYRVMRAGYELVYEPRALVRHRHRRSKKGLYEQLSGHERALMAFLIKTLVTERGRARLGVALFLAWRMIKPGWRLVKRLIGRDDLPFNLLVRSLFYTITGLGGYHFSKWQISSQSR